MKIAILLFGHLRDFEICADSIKDNVIQDNECDVFIHTWDESEVKTVSWHQQRTKMKSIDSSIMDTIKKKYNPKKFYIEHQDVYPKERIIESPYINGLRSSTAGIYWMFYSMKKANEMRKQYQKESGTEYDIVLVTRPDVRFLNKLDINKIITQAKVIGLKMDNCRFFGATPISMNYGASLYINCPNDLLFFGCPSVIDAYINANSDISDEYIDQHFINLVSIYTSKEIDFGINPIPMAYTIGVDWDFSRYRKEHSIESQNYGFIKYYMAKFIKALVLPIIIFSKKYKWLQIN